MLRMKVIGSILLAGTALAGPPEVEPAADAPTEPPAAEEPAAEEPAAEEPAAEPALPRSVAMHRHLGMVQIMHQSVVSGDLYAAREAASALAEVKDIADIPEAWEPWMVVMRESAERASGEWSHADAARTVTEVGRSCGSCHAFTAGGPAEPPKPPEDDFKRHAWAANAMWISILRGDDGSFRAAGEILKAADLGKVPKKNAVRFRELATRATLAHSRAVMADTYGELLDTCTSCHEAMRD